MNTIKITLNGKDFGLRLNQNQIEILKEIKEEKIRGIGDIYDELSEVSPEKCNNIYYAFGSETIGVSSDKGSKMVSLALDNPKKQVDGKELFENLNFGNELIFSLSEVKLNGENSSFLTREQKAFCRREIYRQKQRAKNLFINLMLEADEVSGGKMYYIEWNDSYSTAEVHINWSTASKYFTAYFETQKKCEEVLEKYKDELKWYFTEYQIPLKIKIKIS